MESVESYYSSDEEIAWGPVTLREIKGDLKRGRKKVNRRHTHALLLSESKENMARNIFSTIQESTNKSNASGTDYFTPNESFKTDYNATQNSSLLRKITKVIDDPLTDYSSALDYTTENKEIQSNTVLNILQKGSRESCNNLETIQQSLVENTVILSSDDEDEVISINDSNDSVSNLGESFSSHINIKSEYSKFPWSPYGDKQNVDNEDSCIEISLNDITDLHVQETTKDDNDALSDLQNSTSEGSSDNYKVYQAEYSNITDISVDDEDSKESEYKHTYIKSCSNINQDIPEQKNIQHTDLNADSSEILLDNKCASEQENVHYNTMESGNISNYTMDSLNKENIVCGQNNSEISSVEVPEIDIEQFEDSNDLSGIHSFNDTLEEMERALKQGLDYTMSDDDNVIQPTPLKEEPMLPSVPNIQPPKIISGSFTLSPPKPTFAVPKFKEFAVPKSTEKLSRLKQPNKFKDIVSPVANYIKKSPTDQIKVPKQNIKVTPKTKIPYLSTCNQNLKSIVSPIGVYIKNSPRPCLKQNVLPQDMHKFPQMSKSAEKGKSKDNIENNEFPEVIYRPAKKQIDRFEKKINLPANIKKLVPEIKVTKHETRIKGCDIDKSSMNRKLQEQELTIINNSLMNNTAETDISFLTTKQAYIK